MLSSEQIEKIKEQLLAQIEKLPSEQKESLKEQIVSATPEQIEAFLKQQGGAGECLFCSIAQGKVETVKVYEDPTILAFLDITPAVAGQVIIIPKEHYQFLFQIPDQTLWDVIKVAKLLMPLVVNATAAQGANIYAAQGSAAGQRMEHFALNLIPRFEGDKAVFGWERKEVKKEELEKVAGKIKEGLEKALQEEKEKIKGKLMEAEKKKTVKKEERAEETFEEFPRRMPS